MSAYGTKVVAIIEPQSDVGQKLSSLFTDVQSLKNQMTTLLADAPETLDTLNEIAAAISDDPAFFTTMSTANTTLQTNIDALSTAASTARTALQTLLQAAIDANKLTSDNAESLLSGRLDTLESDPTTATALAAVSGRVTTLEADPTTATAVAAVQADVDQNETDADAADAALSARIATLEADPTTKTYVDTQITGVIDASPAALDTLNELAAALNDDANFATTITNSIAAVQADVNQNETDADSADAALSARITTLEADPTTAAAVAAVQADVDQNESDADTAIALKADIASPTFTGTVGGITKSMVGLGNVDNTADTAKPVSTAQQTAIDAVQADVDANEIGLLAAIASVQSDVDQNEADADAAHALLAHLNTDNVFTGEQTLRDKLHLDPGDGGIKLQLNRNVSSTQFDVLLGNVPSGARLNLTTVNANQDDALVVYSSKFWCRALGGASGDAEFDGDVQIDGSLTVNSTNVGTELTSLSSAMALKAPLADPTFTGTAKAEKIDVDNDGGYFLRFDRNTSTQLDIITGNVPSGGNLNIKNSNANNAKVVVYSDLFWCRNLGGASGNGSARFDGDVTMKLASSVTPSDNSDMMIEATNNTTLTFKLKGSDGTVRSGTITLS